MSEPGSIERQLNGERLSREQRWADFGSAVLENVGHIMETLGQTAPPPFDFDPTAFPVPTPRETRSGIRQLEDYANDPRRHAS